MGTITVEIEPYPAAADGKVLPIPPEGMGARRVRDADMLAAHVETTTTIAATAAAERARAAAVVVAAGSAAAEQVLLGATT